LPSASTAWAEKAHAIELDVRNYSSFERAVAEVVRQSGRIDNLFNNAGIVVSGEVDSYTLDDWNNAFEVNLRGVVHGIQAVYPLMIGQQSGHIVNTASIAGLVTMLGQASYTATKHAIVAISRSLRVEAERHGVQVSVLCPGMVRPRCSAKAIMGNGTRTVRRARPSCRLASRRDHCGASVVEGILVPGAVLANVVDARRESHS
jgi:NADP-dependent 3-hydroxy acid dehydrogenase YdfG